MSQKTMTIRLHCSLDNGKQQWGPGDCVELPEQQAQELLDMDLAEPVDTATKSTSSPKPEAENSKKDVSNG